MDNELKNEIIKVLLDEFSYIDCGKCIYCDTPDCEDYTCYPKQTRWALAPEAAKALTNIIISHFPTSSWKRHNTYYGDDTSGYIDPNWRCENCNSLAPINEYNLYDLTNYCPNCGAKMIYKENNNV